MKNMVMLLTRNLTSCIRDVLSLGIFINFYVIGGSVVAQVHFDELGKASSSATAERQEQLRDSLAFSDLRDQAEAERGFLAHPEVKQVRDSTGRVVWDLEKYDFLLNGDDNQKIEFTIEDCVLTYNSTGVDIVAEQLAIASGQPLQLKQSTITFRGHAIECRINAEDPDTFTPSPGLIKAFHAPGGFGVRFDSHIYQGYRVPHYYDSMIGKLICHAPTRALAIRRMQRALSELVIEGVKTNIPMHQMLLGDQTVQAGEMPIHYLETLLSK